MRLPLLRCRAENSRIESRVHLIRKRTANLRLLKWRPTDPEADADLTGQLATPHGPGFSAAEEPIGKPEVVIHIAIACPLTVANSFPPAQRCGAGSEAANALG